MTASVSQKDFTYDFYLQQLNTNSGDSNPYQNKKKSAEEDNFPATQFKLLH